MYFLSGKSRKSSKYISAVVKPLCYARSWCTNFEIRYIYPERKLNNHSHFQQYKSLATTLTTNYRIWEGGSFLHIKSLSKKEIPRSLQESPMIERSGVSFIRKFIGKFENTAPPIMSKYHDCFYLMNEKNG